MKESHSVHLRCLLRPGAERRGEGTGQRGQQEAAAVPYHDGRASARHVQPSISRLVA